MLTIKSLKKRLFRPGLSEPTFLGFVLAFFFVAPASYGSQLAVVHAVQGEIFFDRWNILPMSQDEPRLEGKNKTAQPGEIGTIYRRTKNGWEDSSKWRIQSAPIPQQLDAVHPAIWTLLVICLVFLVLLGCSKETEIDRLFADLDRFFERNKSGP